MSRLGFGCSGLMARLSRADSLRLLSAAFDSGITHFDCARMYGYGEAEGVLGEFIQSRRGAVTVTTKVGILPPSGSPVMTAVRSVARGLASLHPSVRAALRRRAEAMTQGGCFDLATVQASVQASLKQLRTDYFDLLLLHDCTAADLKDPALAAYLTGLKTAGTVRAIGLATSYQVAADACFTHPALAGVVQFANSPWRPNLDGAGWTAGHAVVTHSALGPRFAAVGPALAADPRLASLWSQRLGFDARDAPRLAQAFLSAAMASNDAGCVLFSSRRPAAIAANAAAQPQPGTWADLRDLVRTLPGAAP